MMLDPQELKHFKDKSSRDPKVVKLYLEHDFISAYARHTDMRVKADPRDAIGGLWEEYGDLIRDYLIQRRGLLPSHRFLDLGCGTGRLSRKIVPYLDPGNYVGLDISYEALNYARKLGMEEGWAEKKPTFSLPGQLALEEKKFDRIWAFSVVIHLPESEVRKIFHMVARLLAPGGQFLFSHVPTNKSKRTGLKQFKHAWAVLLKLADEVGLFLEPVPEGEWPGLQEIAVATQETKYPRVIGEFETMRELMAGKSIGRLGDGELKHLFGHDGGRQAHDPELTAEMRHMVRGPHPMCLVGIPTLDKSGPKYQNWKRHERRFMQALNPAVQYHSSFISRPDSAPWINTREFALMFQSLWAGKRAVIVAKKGGKVPNLVRMAAASTLHVGCPLPDAYKVIDSLEKQVIDAKPDVAILSCGPTATVLAHRLAANHGIQAIDFGSGAGFLIKLLLGREMTKEEEDVTAEDSFDPTAYVL